MKTEALVTRLTGFVTQLAAGTISFFVVLAVGVLVGTEWSSRAIPVVAMIAAVSLLCAAFRRQATSVLIVGSLGMGLLLLAIEAPSPTRDARRAQGEQLLLVAMNQARVAYSKPDGRSGIRTLTGPSGQGGCGVQPEELQGKYFRVRDGITVTETGATLVAEPMQGHEAEGVCTLTFNWQDGDGVFTWVP